LKTILMLGAGVMQAPAIRIARNKGWRVVAADGNPSAVAGTLADRFECVDLKDLQRLLALARDCAARYGLDGVFTAGTDFSSSVAWICERLGLPGISYAAAMRATDKCLMRKAFETAGVPSPRFGCWSGGEDPVELLNRGLSFPLVVKPVDNMGARGVRRVDDAAALVDACRAAIALSRSSRVIVEHFIEGRELSLDAVVYNGAVTICGVADRHICFPPSFVEMGHTMPTDLDADTVQRVVQVFTAGIHAIGISNGAAKGDIKLSPEGPVVGEIAARLSGGFMSGWTFPLSSGIEVTEAALNIAVGLPPGNLIPLRRHTSAERALISVPGTVAEIAGIEEAKAVPCVKEIFLRADPGQEVVFPSNNVEKCGNVIAAAETRSQAIRAAESALASLWIRLQPGNARTDDFLFRGRGNDAFAGLDAAVRARVAAMPPFDGNPARVAGDPIAVIALPGIDAMQTVDWHGRGFAGAAHCSLAWGGGQFVPDSSAGFALGGLFWRALIRGSAQGAAYLLESAREAARTGRLEQLLAKL
jgi:biotin carboxylase